MKNIKTFEQFSYEVTNEENKLRNLLAAGAIGAASILGSPAKAQTGKAQYPSSYDTKTVSTDAQSANPSQIVEVPQLNSQSLKMKLQTNLNELRSDVNFRSLGPITQIKYYSSGPGKIQGELQFAISPKGENGVTNAQFEIQIIDGKYKVSVLNINFIHVGSQPVSTGQMFVNKANRYSVLVAAATQQGVSSALGGGQMAQTVGNIAAGGVQQAALSKPKPKSNFYLSDVDQNSAYSSQVKEACKLFFQSLENKFHGQSSF